MYKVAMIPVKFYLILLLTSLVLFKYGPWDWTMNSSVELYIFMLFVLIAIYIGYRLGISSGTRAYAGSKSPKLLLKISIYLTLILFLPTIIYRMGSIPDLSIKLITDPALAYMRSHDDYVSTGTAWVEYIRIVLNVYLLLLVPLLVVYWDDLTIVYRALGILAALSNIMLWVGTGTNKGLADIAITFLWATIVKYKGKLPYKYFIIISVFSIFFAYFFVQGQLHRHTGKEVIDTIYFKGQVKADRKHFLLQYMPLYAQEGFIAFTSYWLQGYNGLGFCLEEPFVPTFGFGNSRFTATYIDKYFDTDFTKQSYPARAEKTSGWDSKNQWHTIFPWLASDVTFAGSILVIGLFSYFFAMSWTESLTTNNPYALSLFCQFSIMFSYITANNQVLQTFDGYIGFMLTFLMWRCTRSKLKYNSVAALARSTK